MKAHLIKSLLLLAVAQAMTRPVQADFGPPVTSNKDGGRVLLTGDVNNDGRDDLLVFSNGSVQLTVLLGKRDGTLRRSAQLKGPKGVLIEELSSIEGFGQTGMFDVNGDGNLDVVAISYTLHGKIISNGAYYPPSGSWSPNRTIWLGTGDGEFGSPTTTSGVIFNWYLPPDVYPRKVARADFDNNGFADSTFFRQDSYSKWRSPVEVNLNYDYQPYDLLYFDIGSGPCLSIGAGDFNGDGWDDIVVAGATKNGEPNNQLRVILNDGVW